MKEKIVMQSKGITLVALVITIIVLLILAGVSIAALGGQNGILNNATEAKKQSEIGDVKDQARLDINAKQVEKLSPEITDGELEEILLKYGTLTGEGNILDKTLVTKNGYEIPVKDIWNGTNTVGNGGNQGGRPSGTVTPGVPVEGNPEYKDDNGDIAVIPDGFKVSEKEDEQIIDKGLVVIAPDGSEFVWVPVDKDTLCADGVTGKEIAEDLGGENYRGQLYKFSGTTSSKRSYSSTSYREPDIVTDYDNDEEEYLSAIGLTQETFQNQMTEDYNNMIKSIKQYGGFYVGRYESSLNGEKVQSKVGVMPTSAGDNNQMWYGLYDKERSYAKDNNLDSNIESSMIWGSQYDAIMNWALQGSDNEKVTGSSTKHGPDETGSLASDKINNIFDLGNNLKEWTLEANYTYSRVCRGGNYDDALSASVRSSNDPDGTSSNYTSRLTLIIRSTEA